MKTHLEDLEKLDDLLKRGILSEEEFKREKEKLLNPGTTNTSQPLFGLNENTYCFLIHLSVFAGFIHIALAIIAPVALWAMNKSNSPSVDQHGKNVINWILSFAIYLAIAFILFFKIGHFGSFSYNFQISSHLGMPFSAFTRFLPLFLLLLLNIVFILKGALKANNGEIWSYPFSIKFIR